MTAPLEHDLARWEAGQLTLDDLRRLHPGEDIAGLMALHQQLSALVAEPTPDPAGAWAALAARLPVAPVAAVHRRRRPRRAVVAAIIASALAVPTVSYAAAPDAVRSVVREVRDLLPGGTDDDPVLNRPGASDGPPATAVEPDAKVPTTSTGAPPLPSAGSPALHPVDADGEPSESEAPDEELDDTERLPDDQPQTDDPDDGSDDAPDTETETDPAEPGEAEPDGDASGSADLDDLDDAAGESSVERIDD